MLKIISIMILSISVKLNNGDIIMYSLFIKRFFVVFYFLSLSINGMEALNELVVNEIHNNLKKSEKEDIPSNKLDYKSVCLEKIPFLNTEELRNLERYLVKNSSVGKPAYPIIPVFPNSSGITVITDSSYLDLHREHQRKMRQTVNEELMRRAIEEKKKIEIAKIEAEKVQKLLKQKQDEIRRKQANEIWIKRMEDIQERRDADKNDPYKQAAQKEQKRLFDQSMRERVAKNPSGAHGNKRI